MNQQKTPLAQSLNRFTEKKIDDYNDLFGRILPCSVVAVNGAFVTVNFEVLAGNLTLPQVTMPIAESQYTRLPIQVGDKGICLAADTRLGGITGAGLEGSPAPLSNPSNLGGLVFMPVGNKNWFTVNGNYLVLYGPQGVEITVPDQSVKLVLTTAGITITGNVTINGNVSTTGTLTNNGKSVGSTHVHSGVQSGGSNSGPPT